jgi:hypothetical protein
MAEVDGAADNAERALRRMQAQGVVGAIPQRKAPVAPVMGGLVLASLLMSAKVLGLHD